MENGTLYCNVVFGESSRVTINNNYGSVTRFRGGLDSRSDSLYVMSGTLEFQAYSNVFNLYTLSEANVDIVFYSGTINPFLEGKELSLVGNTVVQSSTTLSQFDLVHISSGDMQVISGQLTIKSLAVNGGNLLVKSEGELIIQSDADVNNEMVGIVSTSFNSSLLIQGILTIEFITDKIQYGVLYPVFKAYNGTMLNNNWFSGVRTDVLGNDGDQMAHTFKYIDDTIFVTLTKDTSKSKNILTWWKITLIVVGCVLFLLLMAGFGFFLWRRHKLQIGYLKLQQHFSMVK
ncbi:hypothetical protein PPL_06574 [Heterostelium album PN500]|uniref:Uncharacterized protein n=1 Tax=Heterostelium pallidum (strain ATCC 26659 / Pp 5 / PN500) TaxID=670386 RepID=D3BDJ1_HETP5|nr:hypothetical protein PPL_06574 [Heterostelium album PN500]EFA80536.1 hypothetical protein PPL_06574 [Heterostelium album PN500]|eukprot:XP_020432656.1 hypothetical protein PPL_06574 [Heterostelium album PN500]